MSDRIKSVLDGILAKFESGDIPETVAISTFPIRPFFENHQVMLHEIQLDTLDRLLRSLKTIKHRAPKPYKPEPLKPIFDPVKPVPPSVDMRSFHSTLKSQINHKNLNPIDDLDRRLPPRQENFLGRDIDFQPFDIMFEAAKKVT